ncbi:MAG: IS110 family transposase [bacterium]|nr:IS110 family transposase [bacterium]
MAYVCTGIDVSAKKLQVASEGSEFEVDNTPEGHQKLIQRLQRHGREIRVCMESTGVYGLDLAMTLYHAKGIEVMVLNPRVARNFARVLMHRSKTDPVDARVLRKYVQRMDFLPWRPPAIEKLQLRAGLSSYRAKPRS